MTTADEFEAAYGSPVFQTTFQALAEGLDGNGILDAGDLAVTAGSSSNTLDVAATTRGLWYDGGLYTYAGATDALTLSSNTSGSPRWDLVYFDTGTSSPAVREGTPATKPDLPKLQAGEFALAAVYLPDGTTDVTDSEISDYRVHGQAAEETWFEDSPGEFSSSTVEGAFTEVIRKAGNDPLNGPLDLSSFTGTAPFDLGDDPGAFGQIVDATATSGLSAGTEVSYTFALDSTTVLQIYAEADGGGGLQNVRVNLSNSDLYAGSTQIYDSSADEILQDRLGGPPGSLTSYPLPIGDLDSPYPLPSITDMDADGTDLIDSTGPGVLYDASTGLFPRGVLDDERTTSGLKTANYTTSGEEVITVDTSGGTVTITLASADTNSGNVVTIVDAGGAAETNNISVDTEGSETIDGATSKTIAKNYGGLVLISDGTNWFTASGSAASGGVNVEDNGGAVLSGATGLDFGTDLSATDNGDGTVTIDSDAAGVTVLSTGTFTHTGGSASSTTVAAVTTDETTNLYVEVGVDADPSFSADYAWSYSWGEAWDDSAQEKDVTINATWDTDPGSGNDVTLDYRIYTLDVSVSKSEVQNLVDSPNGHVPTALLEDTESVEISVPVPDGENLKVYRWGAFKISDGTAPTGLQVQLLDGSDTVQASENTVNTENTSSPVASYGNATGSLSIFKLRVDNATGNAYTTDGVGGLFAYVVE